MNLGGKKTFLGIKCYFLRILADSRGKYRMAMTCSLIEEETL